MNPLSIIQPPGWKKPKGYANGVLTQGRTLFIAGQVGWNAQEEFTSLVLHEQWAQALDNVLEVLRTAGGVPAHVARMTVYVGDKNAYVAQRKEIGLAWKTRMGNHYPAMALLEVKGFLEAGALVEIEATAVLPHA